MGLWPGGKRSSFLQLFEEFRIAYPGRCETRPGLSSNELRELEGKLGEELLPSFEEFLKVTNGADFFERSLVLFGSHVKGPPFLYADIADVTSELRSEGTIPQGAIALGQRASSIVILWNPSEKKPERISVWDPAESLGHDFDSLHEWFEGEVRHWAEVLADEDVTERS